MKVCAFGESTLRLIRLIGRTLCTLYHSIKFLAAYCCFLFSSKADRTVLLFGEKDGHEARDNAAILFHYLITQGHHDVFYVLSRRSPDWNKMASIAGSQLVRRNSLNHYLLLFQARVVILNDGILDVYPNLLNAARKFDTPIFYLQHGILRYKTVFFHSRHYSGRIVRFVTSLLSEQHIVTDKMMSRSDFKAARSLLHYMNLARGVALAPSAQNLRIAADWFRSQSCSTYLAPHDRATALKNATNAEKIASQVGLPAARAPALGLPRHDRLIALSKKRGNEVLVFFTFRDYWRTPSSSELVKHPLYQQITDLARDEAMQRVLQEKDLTLRIVLHNKLRHFAEALRLAQIPRLVISSDDEDLQIRLAECRAVITDFSSVSLDAALIDKPVVFYQPDVDLYERSRGTYVVEEAEWVGPRSFTPQETASLLRKVLELDSARHGMTLRNDYPNLGRATEATANELLSLPPSITFICYNIFGVGGTVRTVANMANYLYAQGYHVTIISLKKTQAKPTLNLHPGIRIKVCVDATQRWKRRLPRVPSLLLHRDEDLYKRGSLLIDIWLVWHLRHCTSDVVIATFPSLAAIANRFTRKRAAIVVQEHKFFKAHSPSLQAMIRHEYVNVDGILTLTELDAFEYMRATHKPVFVVPNGVPLSPQITVQDIERSGRIVALGRLVRQKQFHLLIDAFAILARDFPGWEVVIYGDGPEKGSLEKQIQKLGLQSQVFLPGSTNNAGEAIAESDICAVTSEYEGFGMVFIEAYAARKPVVTFDVERGPKEIVIDGKTGLKASPFDVADYAKKLRYLMQSKRLRTELGDAGHRLFMEKYHIEVVGRKFEATIATILQTKHKKSVDLGR